MHSAGAISWRERGGGFGAAALSSLLAEESPSVLRPHHPAKAKAVIQSFMLGGASQCDTFVSWMAGGGTKGGSSYGESDEFSYVAEHHDTMCYDQHATMLYLLGYDHTKVSFRHNGVDRRLTDVHGDVLRELLL